MIIKHKVQFELLDLSKITDQGVQQAISDILSKIYDMGQNIYDDLQTLKVVERVDALPTAEVEYLGRFMLLANTGAEDTLHFCIFDDSDQSYHWKEVTLT